MRRVSLLPGKAAVATLTAFAVLAPLAVHWLAGRTLVWFDTLTLYAPQRWIVDEALRAFRLPLWNPYAGGGMPFFADAIHGVLHPVSVLTAFLHSDRSADVLVGGYVACAGLGGALLASELGASRPGAVLAGAVYGGSGYVLSMAGNLVFLAGAGSLPFCVAGLRRFAVRPAPGPLLLGVGGAAVLALSGDAQGLMVGGLLALALSWEAGGWRAALRAVAAGVLGLLVAAVQLVPSAVHLPRTVRTEGLWSAAPEVWAFEPWRLAELAVPGFLGGEDPYLDPLFRELAHTASWPGGGFPFPFAPSVFVGLVPLTLAAAGAREGRRGRLLAACALVLLWIAVGPALGAAAVLGHVPIWKAFRYAEKLVGPLTLALGLLAALGLDAVAERRAGTRQLLAVAGLMGLASAVALYALSSGLAPDLAPLARDRLARGVWHVAAAAAALGACLLGRERLGGPRARLALVAAAWAGVVAASPAALRPGDPSARLRPSGPAVVAAPPGPRIVTPATVARAPHVPGADRTDEFARDFAAVGHPAYNVHFRFDSLNEYTAMAPPRLAMLRAFFQDRWPVVARRYAATHVFVDPALRTEQPQLYAEATEGASLRAGGAGTDELWEVPHRPWASFAPEVRTVSSWSAAALEAGRALGDGSGAAVVEASSPFRVAPGRVLALERGIEELRVEAESEGDATLVVADAWWPGWEATIDGRSVTVFPADVLVRAVRWPAGRHVLEMRYRPPEVRTGWLLSALGVAVAAAWAAFLRRASRTSPVTAEPPARGVSAG